MYDEDFGERGEKLPRVRAQDFQCPLYNQRRFGESSDALISAGEEAFGWADEVGASVF